MQKHSTSTNPDKTSRVVFYLRSIKDILFTCRFSNPKGSKNMEFIGMSGTLEQSYIIRPFPGCRRPEKPLGESKGDFVARLVRLFFYVPSL